MIIKFKNWEKYQPRKDHKHPRWFALNNNFFNDPKIWELSIEEVYFTIFLMCEASKNNKNGEIYINRDYCRVQSRVSDRVQSRTIKKLQTLQIIDIPRVLGKYSKVLDPNSTIHNNTIQNNTEQYKESMSSDDDPLSIFEIWNLNCKSLPKSQVLSEKRARLCRQRWKEKPDKIYWQEVIRKISESEFANGKNDRGWKATIDFILQPDRHLQIMEGKFDNKTNEIKKTDYKKLLEDL